ncbi:hypothetical protein K501DRAFT_268975 [Backusella circina FSU 941]|nr:hypothetical protein K501DRAFT_268975 [Backusella circina FSU 941]
MTEKQIQQLIGYVGNEKLTLPAASKKTPIGNIVGNGMSIREASSAVNMSCKSGYTYYKRYTKDPNQNIPMPHNQENRRSGICTQDQIERLVHYMVTLLVKTYDPEHRNPNPKEMYGKQFTEDQIRELIGYIVDDKVSLLTAAIKLKMSETTAKKYYI